MGTTTPDVTVSPADAARVVRRAQADPVFWLRQIVGREPNGIQARILKALTTHRVVVVPSCHGSGKTWVAAAAVLHNTSSFPGAISVTTAPGQRQVRRGMWKEIRTLHAGSRIPIGGGDVNVQDWEIAPDWYALGFTAPEHDADRFRGLHSPTRILIVVDEAGGVSEDIFTGLKGALTGQHPRALYIGHPTMPTGEFADAIEGRRSGAKVIRITVFDTPNLKRPGITLEDIRSGAWKKKWEGHEPAPHELGLVDPVWVRERWEEWGEGDPRWQALVMAQIPDDVAERVFARALVEEAAGKPPEDTGGPVEAGIDPAGPGEDETAWCIRAGDSVLDEGHSGDADARGRVMHALHPYKDRIKVVRVDATGEGRAFARHLQDFGFPVMECAFGGDPVGVSDTQTKELKEEYANLKAQIHWALRERLREGRVRGFRDEVADRQMTAIGWGVDRQGRIVIERKESIERREGYSPDRAEARVLAFAGVYESAEFFIV